MIRVKRNCPPFVKRLNISGPFRSGTGLARSGFVDLYNSGFGSHTGAEMPGGGPILSGSRFGPNPGLSHEMGGPSGSSLENELTFVRAELAQARADLARGNNEQGQQPARMGTSHPSIVRRLNFNTPTPGPSRPSLMPRSRNDYEVNTDLIRGIVAELQTLRDQYAKIPGVPAPLEQAAPESYADSPFAYHISLVEIPKKFAVPNIKSYNGIEDPVEHVAQYKQRMTTIPIPATMREACFCKGFGSTLSGPAL